MVKDCWNCKHRDGILFVDNTRCNECTRDHFLWEAKDMEKQLFTANIPQIDRVIYNDPATVIIWKDGTKTVVKCMGGEDFDPEKGFAMAYLKKVLGKEYGSTMRKYVKPELKKREEPDLREFTFEGLRASSFEEAMKALGEKVNAITGYKDKHDKAKEQKNG